jgi:hypothetical protein
VPTSCLERIRAVFSLPDAVRFQRSCGQETNSRDARVCILFQCSPSTFANYTCAAKSKYYALRTARHPETFDLDLPTGRGASTTFRKRCRAVSTVLDPIPSNKGFTRLRVLRTCWPALVLLVFLCKTSSAQETQFLPEVDTYLKVHENIRLSVQAKDTREGGDPTQAEIGPSIEFYTKPWIRLREISVFDLNDAKKRPLVLAAGYRYLASPTSPSTYRIPFAATSHLPIKAQLLLTDRNRTDLDWSSGKFTWRYRNMLSLDRTLAIHSYHPIPYASAEIYYESQYSKMSTTELYAGCFLPIGKHFELTPYYEHQNNTGKKPNKQLQGLGLTLNIYLSK